MFAQALSAQSAYTQTLPTTGERFSRRVLFFSLASLLLSVGAAQADIAGVVRDAITNQPLAGARVHVQADPGGPAVLSAMDGSYLLPVSPVGLVTVAGSVQYDAASPINYITGSVLANDGDIDADVNLLPLPAMDNLAYSPPPVATCGNCHPDQEADWQQSNHSFAAVDTWVLDLYSGTGTPGGSAGYVYEDLHDPGETGFCATCHVPMADVFDPGNTSLDDVVAAMDPGVLDGISCVACHQMDQVSADSTGLHHVGGTTYRFPEGATEQYVWGPLDDVNVIGMAASYQPQFKDPIFCASCHQYNNPTTGAPGQTTYSEWLASPFSQPGPNFRTCQTCHMPEAGAGALSVIGIPRPSSQRHTHQFVGATGPTLSDAIVLRSSVSDAAGVLRVRVEGENQGAGHAFPTGISIRNALLVISATLDGIPLVQASGPVVPFYGSDDVPGIQPGDYAGQPGKGFAKVLEGRINGVGPVQMPVLFIDAEGVFADTAIPSGAIDLTEVELALPVGVVEGDTVEVEARLLYRRAYRALAVTKGWTETPQGGPVEIEVAAESSRFQVSAIGAGGGGITPIEIPASSNLGLVLLAVLLSLTGLRLQRRRRL
jgi:hypothetical protein